VARFAVPVDIRPSISSVSDFTMHLVPMAIYTIPEMSSIGKTEDQLQRDGQDYIIGLSYYNEIAKACISGDNVGLLKMLINPHDRRILGIHAIGDQAAEIIHIGMMVMLFNGPVDTFINNVFNYPTWAEVYRTAALSALKKM
jgi:NAD(P) transhydrogenase